MYKKGLSLVVVLAVLVMTPACGHEQQLTSITVQPNTETFGSATIPVSADQGLQVQLRALGNYIHPPVTKDITSQVVWNSNTPQMVTVNSTGLLTATGGSCGNALVSATVTTNTSTGNISSTGALVTGYMTANVVCFTGGAGGSGFSVTVNFAGTGITNSTPPGLSCAGPCSNIFAAGTTIVVTATPTPPSTTASWAGCDSGDGTATCTISNLNSNRVITITFS
jgi:hypothetical protein